ncbi:hypothetical protein PN36_15635 [Candidatus Thiomargarita nelsonii]|uniref:Uncharacterized protein n=1 Tax=Candidatus Thiomargarita nelsonii TaxID=1003181 RepID=A0A4E0QPY2_9GAMM|nr:hypothetical protein PN36_15635 [Candidatus Thiomargarita nelsonii]
MSKAKALDSKAKSHHNAPLTPPSQALNATFVKGNHKGLPLQTVISRRGNPLWLPLTKVALGGQLQCLGR